MLSSLPGARDVGTLHPSNGEVKIKWRFNSAPPPPHMPSRWGREQLDLLRYLVSTYAWGGMDWINLV
jgi:hypothetical protein